MNSCDYRIKNKESRIQKTDKGRRGETHIMIITALISTVDLEFGRAIVHPPTKPDTAATVSVSLQALPTVIRLLGKVAQLTLQDTNGRKIVTEAEALIK
jgi:hypothetical protein